MTEGSEYRAENKQTPGNDSGFEHKNILIAMKSVRGKKP